MGQLRTYLVETKDGQVHEIKANYAFNNSSRGEGLVFRLIDPEDRDRRTEIIAQFETGAFNWYKIKQTDEETGQ